MTEKTKYQQGVYLLSDRKEKLEDDLTQSILDLCVEFEKETGFSIKAVNVDFRSSTNMAVKSKLFTGLD